MKFGSKFEYDKLQNAAALAALDNAKLEEETTNLRKQLFDLSTKNNELEAHVTEASSVIDEQLELLKVAEEALYAEETLSIEVEGDDEGEKLTHVLAAIFILEKMSAEGMDYKTALRAYTSRVRESIN
jgi:phage repressor protein C with HTH and peptisase S24 domain